MWRNKLGFFISAVIYIILAGLMQASVISTLAGLIVVATLWIIGTIEENK